MRNATLTGPPSQLGASRPLDMLIADPLPATDGRHTIPGADDRNGHGAASREDED